MTGTGTEHPAEDAPVPVQVITREEILSTASTNVADVLDRVPGIYVRQNEEFRLGASTIRMQGADANKVAILLNGRRFRGGLDGVVDLRDISVANIERVEIIRGPASSLYGSDAMGGVINIITRGSSATPSFSATSAGGTSGALLLRAAHGYRVGPLGYFLSYQHDEVEIADLFGAISGQFAGEAGDAKQVRDNAFAQLDWQPTDDQQLSFTGDYAPVREGPQSERQNLTLAGDWHWQASDLADLSVGAGRYGFERTNELPGFEEDVRYEDWSGDGRLQHGWPHGLWGESHLLTIGHRFRREAIDQRGIEYETSGAGSFTTPDVKESALLNSPFLQNEILFFDTATATVGTSVDVHNRFGVEANPRVSLSWRPVDAYRISAVVGRGYRAPDLRQLFDADFNNIVVTPSGINGYVILGNPDLQPETDLAWNLQIDAHPRPGVSGFLTLFRHDFDDLIAIQLCEPPDCTPDLAVPLPPLVFQYENVARARTQGAEVSLSLHPFDLVGRPLANHRVRLDISYAYLDSEDRSGRDGFDGNELPFRPPHRFLPTLGYEYVPWDLQLQVAGEYEDRAYADIANTTIVHSHWLWSFKSSVRLAAVLPLADRLNGWRDVFDGFTGFVEGQNVFDEEVGFPGPMGAVTGRATFLAGVEFEL